MPRKEDSKKHKSKGNQPPDQLQRYLGSPDKKEEDHHKNMKLSDLSPYSPILRTIKKSFDHAQIPYDFAMIETPNIQRVQKSFLEEIQGHVPQISKVLNWGQDDDEESQDEGSPFDKISQEEISSSKNISNENQHEGNPKAITTENLPANQILGKAGELQNKNKRIKETAHKRKSEPVVRSKKLTCNCKKTQCLKLYCDCFRENQVCGKDCNCTGCHNTEDNEVERNNAMLTLMERNPEAFKPKLEAEQHAKGCNCKRSACLKKYCECYQAGLTCGEHCKCQDCKNMDPKKNPIESNNQAIVGPG